ncbi:hypothetical protein PS2_031414 [Malus domestica]
MDFTSYGKSFNIGSDKFTRSLGRYTTFTAALEAPELIFGATEYTSTIDVWSVGCVLAELLLGQPLFPGDSGVDQLVEIIKVLGTPTREEIKCMNPKYTEFKFPQIKAHPWHKIFHKRMPSEAVDLVSRLLQYSPNLWSTALDALVHSFFYDLRDPNPRHADVVASGDCTLCVWDVREPESTMIISALETRK